MTLLIALTLSGCSIFVPEIESAVEPEIAAVPTEVESPQPAKLPLERPRMPPVAIVLTNSQPAFLDVANALTAQLDDIEVYDLSANSQPPVSVLRAINDSDSGVVVAIGLRAAKSSVAMADAPVVFSQVFNYQDYGLLTANSRGVAALAPLDAQLVAWTNIDAGISRVGIIVGEGHDDLIAEAQLAAEKHKVELRVRIAHSDQETIYMFRRMAQDIDGFWLFPDNRILSARSLQQILATAKRRKVSVVVPNDSVLKMGGTISITTQAEDVAATIARVVRQIYADGLQSVPAISPLSAIRVVTRDGSQVVSR